MYKLIKLAQNKLFVVAMMLVVSAVFIAPAFAGEEPAGGSAGGSEKTDVFGIKEVEKNMPLGKQDFVTTITSLINVLLGLLGVVAVVIILIAGFKWMTAGGNDDKVSEARKMLFAGIIGLAIILSAWAIARFVLVQLGNATAATDLDGQKLL
jgi:hypothetical protein